MQLLANRVVNRAANLNPLGKRPYIFFGCFVFVSPIVYLSWPGLMSNRPLEKETKQNMGKESHLLQLSKSKCVMALWRKKTKNKKTGVCCHVCFFGRVSLRTNRMLERVTNAQHVRGQLKKTQMLIYV